MFGPQGFNDLAASLPGRISRSVLADRLRRLETLGLVSHRDGHDPHPAYCLTSVGQGLMPTLASLRAWADTWLPDDPDMVERDPDILLGWLGRRVDSERLPERPVVLELRLRHRHDKRYWLVLQRGADAYGCLTDPLPGRRPLRLPRLLHAGAPGDRQGQERACRTPCRTAPSSAVVIPTCSATCPAGSSPPRTRWLRRRPGDSPPVGRTPSSGFSATREVAGTAPPRPCGCRRHQPPRAPCTSALRRQRPGARRGS